MPKLKINFTEKPDIVLIETFLPVVGTSATACNDDYRGPSPFSEVEVRNVRKYLEGIKHRLKAFWNIHAYSQMILTPWSYTKDLPKDYDEIVRAINMQTPNSGLLRISISNTIKSGEIFRFFHYN